MVIICSLKPFIFSQKLFVLNDDGNVEITLNTSIKDFVELLCEVANKYQCNKIKMTGSITYAKGFEGKIRACYLAKYSKNDLEIEYI